MEEAEVGVVVRQEWVSEARPELWCEGALARLSIRRQAVAGRRRVAVPLRLLAEPLQSMPREWTGVAWDTVY